MQEAVYGDSMTLAPVSVPSLSSHSGPLIEVIVVPAGFPGSVAGLTN